MVHGKVIYLREIPVIFFVSLDYVETHMFRSSYSQILQVWDGSQREEAAFITAGVYDDFSRALLCISSVECKYGLLEKDLKRCFLVNVKPDLSQRRSDELESEKSAFKKGEQWCFSMQFNSDRYFPTKCNLRRKNLCFNSCAWRVDKN